jgi:hypothetical protein
MRILTPLVALSLATACSGRALGDSPAETSSGEASGGDSAASTVTSGTPSTSSTDAGDGATTEGEVSTDGGGDFVERFDLDQSCGQTCDIWDPESCPEGEKCTAVSCEEGSPVWDWLVCRPVQGSGQAGDECQYTDGNPLSGNDTCDEGQFCFNVDQDTGIGTCAPWCTGSPDDPMCPAGYSCAVTSSGVLALCIDQCDPLLQDCANPDDLCINDPTGEGYVCVLNASGDMAPYGTPCNYANVCNHGLLCVDAALVPEDSCDGASGCCSPFCDLGAPNACPGLGQECVPMYDPQPETFEHVGVCVLPF